MNEHIRDLYEQACDIERENELATKPYKDRVVITFAELIVKECAGIANRAEPYQATDLILKHFGVEK